MSTALIETIAALVPEGSRVLDLGCGTGELLAWLQDRKSTRLNSSH